MSGKRKLLRNAPLEKGDDVICVKMEDEYSPIPTGMKGKVKNVSNVFGEKQYYVNWKNGSQLALIDGVDHWMKVIEPTEDDENVNESLMFFKTKKQMINETKNMPKEFVRLSKMYEIWKIYDFLEKLRQSGVVNMFASYPYLYLGKERIEHEHKYTNKNDEEFKEVLDMADDIRNVMIRGAIKHTDNKRKEDTKEDEDDNKYLRSVENQMRKDAQDILYLWTKLKGGTRQMK